MATFEQAIAELASAESTLRDARQKLVEREGVLFRAEMRLPDKDISDFNRLRSRLAQDAAYFVRFVIGQLEAQDQSAFFSRGTRADEFRAQLRAKIGTDDGGEAILNAIPVLKRQSNGNLAGGLGALPVGVIAVALAIGAAALAVGFAVSMAADSLFSKATDLKAKADQMRARQECAEPIIARMPANATPEEIVKAVNAVCGDAPNPNEPGGGPVPGWVVALGIGAAAVVLWPILSTLGKKGIEAGQARASNLKLAGRRRKR